MRISRRQLSGSPARNAQLSQVMDRLSNVTFRMVPVFVRLFFLGVALMKIGSPFPHQPGAPGSPGAFEKFGDEQLEQLERKYNGDESDNAR